MKEINLLSQKIIGCAIQVHRILGPGLLESVYQAALAHEFGKTGLCFEKEKSMPVIYDSIKLDVGFRCDFLVENQIIIECKAVKDVGDIEVAQLLNYLKISHLSLGLLINLNVTLLKNGIKRIANNLN